MPSGKPIIFQGVLYTSQSKAAEAHGIKAAILTDRLSKGWSIEEALGLQNRARKHTKTRKYTNSGREKIRLANHRRWVADSKAKHQYKGKDKFDYKDTGKNYNTQKGNSVSIRCLLHQKKFLKRPHDHLRYPSGGCPQCEFELRSSSGFEDKKQKFLSWFNKNCGNRLEVGSEYLGMGKNMLFKCKIHGTSKHSKPTELKVNGYWGCDGCAKQSTRDFNKLDQDELYKELSPLLPDHIYIKKIIFNQSTQIQIVCNEHGEDTVSADYIRKSNHKCPTCGRLSIGFADARLRKLIENDEEGRPCYIGVMEVEVFGIRALKVGVTIRTLKDRYVYNLKRIFFSAQMAERDAYILENQIRRTFREYCDERIFKKGMREGKRWGGDTECFWFRKKKDIINHIETFIERLKFEKPDYWNELIHYEVPDRTERYVGRKKNENNKPKSVVGIHPETNEILRRFSSFSEAMRNGYHGVSINVKNKSGLVGGLRWFEEKTFNPEDIPPLSLPKNKRAIQACYDNARLLGVDPKTGNIERSFSNIQAAEDAGFKTVFRSILNQNRFVGGLRWTFEPINIESSSVEEFSSMSEALRAMKAMGYILSLKGIRSSIKNSIPDRNGFRWSSSEK